METNICSKYVILTSCDIPYQTWKWQALSILNSWFNSDLTPLFSTPKGTFDMFIFRIFVLRFVLVW